MNTEIFTFIYYNYKVKYRCVASIVISKSHYIPISKNRYIVIEILNTQIAIFIISTTKSNIDLYRCLNIVVLKCGYIQISNYRCIKTWNYRYHIERIYRYVEILNARIVDIFIISTIKLNIDV